MIKQEAESLVKAELEKMKDKCHSVDCAILEEDTIEKSWGWVFFYQSKAFIKTGDFLELLAGNAPIIVNKNTGELVFTGTAHDIDYYIKEYEATL